MIKYRAGKLYFDGEDYTKVKQESRRLHRSFNQTVHLMLWKGLKLKYPEAYAKVKSKKGMGL